MPKHGVDPGTTKNPPQEIPAADSGRAERSPRLDGIYRLMAFKVAAPSAFDRRI